jgi:hypothetical protein
MDWPSRSIWSQITWTWLRLAKRPGHRVRSWEQPGVDASNRIERLHSLGRHGGRSPLYAITVMDQDGYLLDAAACDPEEYAEYR